MSVSEVPNDPILVYHKTEEEISKICSEYNLILIIDHIKELDFSDLTPFYLNLHQIYRRFEPCIRFMFITVKTLTSREDLKNFGILGTVMVQNVIVTSKFNEKDTSWFIEEKEKHIRDMIRRKLKSLGFAMWQESVYLTPHPIAEEMNEFLEEKNLAAGRSPPKKTYWFHYPFLSAVRFRLRLKKEQERDISPKT